MQCVIFAAIITLPFLVTWTAWIAKFSSLWIQLCSPSKNWTVVCDWWQYIQNAEVCYSFIVQYTMMFTVTDEREKQEMLRGTHASINSKWYHYSLNKCRYPRWSLTTRIEARQWPRFHQYSRTPLIRINWNEEPSGYAENPDNWIFLWKHAILAVWTGGKIYRWLF